MRNIVSMIIVGLLLTCSSDINPAQSIAKKTDITIGYNLAYNIRWSKKDKTWLLATFDQAWQYAIKHGGLAKSTTKPIILTLDETRENDCNGLDARISKQGKKLTFCSSFLLEDYDHKIFAIYHEIGHYVQADFRELRGNKYAQRECTANVATGKLLGAKFVLSLLSKSSYGSNEMQSLYRLADTEAIAVLSGKKKQCSIVEQ